MHRFLRPHIRVRQQGQTLVIALIVLGVLLVLGLVFLGLINRNILNATRSRTRSVATDLAEAGVRYAHGQLLTSGLGADWRGTPTGVQESAPNVTGDPDIYYIRPASGLNLPDGQIDLGGPDGLGPFVRIHFPGGRSLTRVRYGATDATPTPAVAGGPLRNPGAARAQLIIESVGRQGVINEKDPTTFNAQGGLQYRAFANTADLMDNLNRMAQANGQIATSRKMTAFAPIGIIDFARFETNVFKSSAPIEMGIPGGLGASVFDDIGYAKGATTGVIQDQPVGSPDLAAVTGTPGETTSLSGPNSLRGFGSMMFNGDVNFYGRNDVYLNRTLGDGIHIAGRAVGTDGGTLNLYTVQFNPAGTSRKYEYYDPTRGDYYGNNPFRVSLADNGALSYDSQDPNFSTAGGMIQDGSSRTDRQGFPSGVGRLEPPSILAADPDTKVTRYVQMTRESGNVGPRGNDGQVGHGAGVYVNNAADRQEPLDAEGRRIVGSQRALFDDWLNPNSGAAESGWKGPFYVPRGAVVQLQYDGFSIQRDGSSPDPSQRTWKRPNGDETGVPTLRYRLVNDNNGTPADLSDDQIYIVNSLNVADINGEITVATAKANGKPFNGVLYFEGNVRVRGTIPTGVQMTLVSGATIYIEGSIVKGTTHNDVTRGTPNTSITGLPTAALMLMAKDNVAVNTPNFFGPVATQVLESANDVSGATSISPVLLRAAGGGESGQLDFVTELPLDSAGLANASQWRPFALNYRQWDSTNDGVPTQFLLAHTMDDGTASASFLAMNVNQGLGDDNATRYLFAADDGLITNTYATYLGLGAPATTQLYGLGGEPWQRYSRFELRSFPIIANPVTATYTPNGGAIGGQGYPLYANSNNLLLRQGSLNGVSTNDILLGRAALAPSDVRIEASIFAEQGSFFVIPGPWFNPNPNDTHVAYAKRLQDLQTALPAAEALYRANRERLESYGAAPFVPFYGEPLDVKLSIVGSVAENLPPPISVQAQWIKKWGFIPRRLGATLMGIPNRHVPTGLDLSTQNFVPNLTIQYDPVLATGRVNLADAPPLRIDGARRPLPPMPRLPVSPRLAYFGEL